MNKVFMEIMDFVRFGFVVFTCHLFHFQLLLCISSRNMSERKCEQKKNITFCVCEKKREVNLTVKPLENAVLLRHSPKKILSFFSWEKPKWKSSKQVFLSLSSESTIFWITACSIQNEIVFFLVEKTRIMSFSTFVRSWASLSSFLSLLFSFERAFAVLRKITNTLNCVTMKIYCQNRIYILKKGIVEFA